MQLEHNQRHTEDSRAQPGPSPAHFQEAAPSLPEQVFYALAVPSASGSGRWILEMQGLLAARTGHLTRETGRPPGTQRHWPGGTKLLQTTGKEVFVREQCAGPFEHLGEEGR